MDKTKLRGKHFLHICFLVKCSVIDGLLNSEKINHELDDVIKEFR